MNRVISLSSLYLRVYENNSGDDIDDGVPSKRMPQGNILLELPILGCKANIELRTEGYFTRTKTHVINIINYNGDCLELLFHSEKEGDTDRFHEWSSYIQESEERSKSNMSRLVEQRTILSSRVISIGCQTPEVMGRSSVCISHSHAMLVADPFSFAKLEPGSCKILKASCFFKQFKKEYMSI